MNFSLRLFAITIMLFPFFAFGQTNFMPGFVINKKGDTLKGYINLKQWSNNPESITFRELDKPPAPNVTVNDIDYFEVTDNVAYRQFTTSISLDETNIQHLADHRDTSSKTDKVFLKVETAGDNVVLYSYTDDIKTRYYIYDNQTKQIAELIYRIYYVPNDKNNVSTVSQNEYKQQLLLIAQKFSTFNEGIKNLLENANYVGSPLKRICEKINYSAASAAIAKKHQKKYFGFFVSAGANFSSTDVSGNLPLYNSTKSPGSIAPIISLGINLYPSPDVQKIVFRVELAYTSNTYKTTGNLYYYDNTETTLNLVRNVFSITPQIQYNIYNTKSLKFYANLGASLNLASFTGNRVYYPSGGYYQENFLSTNVSGYTVPIKIGATINKHIDISITYIPAVSETDYLNGVTQEFNYSLIVSSLQTMIGYTF